MTAASGKAAPDPTHAYPGQATLDLVERSPEPKPETDAGLSRHRHAALRRLDDEVHDALRRVLRPQEVAYITVGHGEINDPASEWAKARQPGTPAGSADLGLLEQRLSVRFDPRPITDDKSYLRQTGTLQDRRLVATNQVAAHPAMVTLQRLGPRHAMLFSHSGALEPVQVAGGRPAPRRTYLIRSMKEAFADINGNHVFDDGTEQRRHYNLAAAIEAPAEASRGKDARMSVMLFADADIFLDHHQYSHPVSYAVLTDALRWLDAQSLN